ncbi:MAG: hypothetical protein IJ697_00320 [Synergistaceae bacterium]|nr:hypothetical protein [Synergistaceae bacterium]MBR1656897.1 hypothetical protein [Synergistaceae bacterium]
MKRLTLFLMLMMIPAMAYADIEEFRYFSLNVPEGWTAVESGDVVSVSADDKSGSLSITAGSPKGKSIAELAVSFSNELKGTKPVSDDEGNYTFELNNGISQAMITGDEDFYMLIIGTGFVSNGETLGEILGSLEMK